MKRVLLAALALAACLLMVRPFTHSDPEALKAETPAAKFVIPPAELGTAENKALGGDCNAAYRLAQHFSFAVLDEAQAIRWYRVAAKCGHTAAKLELTAMLIYHQNVLAIGAEIETLIADIRTRDPEEARDLAEFSEYMRKRREFATSGRSFPDESFK